MPIGNTTLPNLATRNRTISISSAGLIVSGSVIISGSANTITLSGASTTESPATQTYVTGQIGNLVDSAPTALDTLNELAAAIGDDANYASTISTALGNRLRVDTASQGLDSTQKSNARTNLGLGTAATYAVGDFAIAAQGAKADTAHGWGNHAGLYLGINNKSADSDLIDGIDSSRIVYGDGARASTTSTNMNDPNQKSGFHFAYDPTGAPYTEWWNWITIAGNSWQSSNNYQFQLAHDFHSDSFQVRRMTNGSTASWREVLTSTNYSGYANFGTNFVTGGTFFDGDDTNYYVDPNFTSNLIGLTVANTINGNISGNAGTATSAATWTTARTITIGSTGKSVNGSGDVSWTLSEIGAATAAQGTKADTAHGWGNHSSAGYLTSETNTFLGDGGNADTHPGTDRIIFTGQISTGAALLGMPATDNSNAILNINRHPGEYNSQLGFSSNGSMYYRSFSATAINSSQAWRQVWDSGNLTNNSSNWDTAYGWGNHASAGYYAASNPSGYIAASYLDDYTRGAYRVISDYNSGDTTWYIRSNGQYVWARAHDWSQSFRLNLPSGAVDNSTWAYLGQQQSNDTNGIWRGISITKYANGTTTDGDLQANGIYGQVFYDANDTNYYGNFNTTTRQYQAISFGDSSRYSAVSTTINGTGAGDKLILYGGVSNYDARVLVGDDYDFLFKSQGNSTGRGSYKFYSGAGAALALTIDGAQGLRAGTTFHTSPAGTYFSHTLSAVGTSRVVNFDGNGSIPSVWWTNGTRAYGAIDAQDPGLTLWANDGSNWQKQMSVNYGDVTINTNIKSPIYYDSSNTNYSWDPNTDNSHRFTTPSGYIDIGPKNGGYCHIYNNVGTFYFNQQLDVLGDRVWNAGNDGAGSGLDADTVDGYHASSLWRSDGGAWNPGANITLGQTANDQEWSFDITRNGYTGGYWHVWDSSNSTMLKVDAVSGKVSAPYNFVGNLEGNAATATTAVNLSGLGVIQSTSTGTSYQNNYQIRENSGGGGNTSETYAPQLAFHWAGVVASSIMIEPSGRIAIRNNPGSGYENFVASEVYAQTFIDLNDTNYYLNPAGATSLNIAGQITTAKTNGTLLSIAGADTFGLNDTSGLGVYIKGTGNTYIYGGGKFFDGSSVRTLWHSGDFSSTNVSNWNTAYGWGNHASAGYLTSFNITTQTDPKYIRSDADDVFTGNLTTGADNHITFGPNTTWGSSLRIGGNGRTATGTEMASIVTTDGNIHLDAANSNNGIYLNYYAGTAGVGFGSGASGIVAWMGSDGDLWKGSSDNSGDKYWHAGNAPRAGNSDLFYYEGFTLDANTMANNASGFTYSVNAPFTGPIMKVGEASYYLQFNAPYSGGSGLAFRTRNGDTGTLNAWQYPAINGANINSGGALYATSFIDSADTGYYVDPNGTSNVNVIQVQEAYAGGWLRNYNSNTGLYNQTTTQHWSSNTNGLWDASSTTNATTGAIGIRLYAGGHVNTLRGYLYSDGDGFGLLNNQGGWSVRANQGTGYGGQLYGTWQTTNFAIKNAGGTHDPYGVLSISCDSSANYAYIGMTRNGVVGAAQGIDTSNAWWVGTSNGGHGGERTALWGRIGSGYSSFAGSARAPLFYDSDNTGYYVDPADGDVSAVLKGTVTIGGGTGGNYDEGLRIIDSSNHSVVIFGATGNTGAGRYGFIKDSSDVFQLRNNAGTVIWQTNQTGNTTFSVDVRTPILYDSNNTGYYIDPASTSILGNVRTNNHSTLAGDGHGYGFWQGYGGSDYSIWMSDSSNGTYGGQVSSVGSGNDYNMYFRMKHNNRGFVFITGDNTPKVQIANEGLHVDGDIYADKFYDINNTSYYTDPASTSLMRSLQIHRASIIGSVSTGPDPSALLELTSTNQGFLLPRMSKGDMLAITAPAPGLMVFETDREEVYVFAQGDWRALAYV
jgi:hypothetical protein